MIFYSSLFLSVDATNKKTHRISIHKIKMQWSVVADEVFCSLDFFEGVELPFILGSSRGYWVNLASLCFS